MVRSKGDGGMIKSPQGLFEKIDKKGNAMWYFSSPQIVYGEDALRHLTTLKGTLAALITDANLTSLGLATQVQQILEMAGLRVVLFDQIQPEPDLDTVRQGAAFLLDHQPDWIVALGGGSVIDAAKGMWVLYARPDTDPEAINPIEEFGLREKARFVAIPTTSGTGSEATWAIVLTNPGERRKLGLGSREAVADIAILDPVLVARLPRQLTADTGLDALTHAIEGFTSTYHNDFSDGLCLKAAELVFRYLPRAYQNGADMEAREKMHNAATIAGLGFGNSMAALAHGLGHSLGAVFHIPHGRAVALFLPYSIEYCVNAPDGETRYRELACFLGLPAEDEKQAAQSLVKAVRLLESQVDQPLRVANLGIKKSQFISELEILIDNALNDTQTIMSSRVPDDADLRKIFLCAYNGEKIDF